MAVAPLTRSQRRWLLAIVLVAAVVRVAWCIYAARDPQGLHDPGFYVLYGQQISDGHGYRLPNGEPTAYYPIGYPGLLGAVFWLADLGPFSVDRAGLVAGLNIVLGVATVGVVFELVRRLAEPCLALIAAAIVALYPNLVFHTAVPLSETLFNFVLLVLTFVLLSRPWSPEGLSRSRLIPLGVALGVATLVRPIMLPLVVILPLLWMRAGIGVRRAAVHVGVVVGCAALVILPWTIRNLVVMDAFVPISTNTGDNLCIGRDPDATGDFILSEWCLAGYDHLERPEYEVVRDRETREKAFRRIREHPGDEVVLVVKRGYHTLKNDHDAVRAAESYGDDVFMSSGARRVFEGLADWWYFGTLGLSVVGFAAWLRNAQGDPRRLALVVVGSSTLLAPLVTFGDPRFKVPVLPFLAIGTAAAVELAQRQRGGRSARRSTASASAR